MCAPRILAVYLSNKTYGVYQVTGVDLPRRSNPNRSPHETEIEIANVNAKAEVAPTPTAILFIPYPPNLPAHNKVCMIPPLSGSNPLRPAPPNTKPRPVTALHLIQEYIIPNPASKPSLQTHERNLSREQQSSFNLPHPLVNEATHNPRCLKESALTHLLLPRGTTLEEVGIHRLRPRR